VALSSAIDGGKASAKVDYLPSPRRPLYPGRLFVL
jgi:hypothetical protein